VAQQGRSSDEGHKGRQGLVVSRDGVKTPPLQGLRYSMRIPEMARLMTSSWICSVPSKMSKIFVNATKALVKAYLLTATVPKWHTWAAFAGTYWRQLIA
jgi:hypothetical protein